MRNAIDEHGYLRKDCTYEEYVRYCEGRVAIGMPMFVYVDGVPSRLDPSRRPDDFKRLAKVKSSIPTGPVAAPEPPTEVPE